jgi:hypothetical protein
LKIRDHEFFIRMIDSFKIDVKSGFKHQTVWPFEVGYPTLHDGNLPVLPQGGWVLCHSSPTATFAVGALVASWWPCRDDIGLPLALYGTQTHREKGHFWHLGTTYYRWPCWSGGLDSVTRTLWLFNIAMENGSFIDGLPIKNGDFPWLC